MKTWFDSDCDVARKRVAYFCFTNKTIHDKHQYYKICASLCSHSDTVSLLCESFSHAVCLAKIRRVKNVCFYIVQCPVRWTTQSVVHFTPGRPVHYDTNSTTIGSILVTRQLRTKTIN